MEIHRKLVDAPCPGCGGARLRRPSRKNDLCYSCTTSRRETGKFGELNSGWKGGKAKHSKGYILLRSIGHPRARNNYVFEHILVMEKRLGRYLKLGETVHHKNGLKSDNRDCNLELWTINHPSGARVEDLVKWVVSEYAEDVKKYLDL